MDSATSLPLRVYGFAVNHGARWPLGRARPAPRTDRSRIGYYLWRFPSLTGTYIQREVTALRQAGLDVEVFADVRERDELLDDSARALIAETYYLLPIAAERLRIYRQRVRRRDPFGFLNAFAYTALHRYAAHKNPSEDLRIFHHALYLAGLLLERGITHLHAPWANLSAFIALLAARMAGVPFSVQARASTDLFGTRSRWALAEKFARAQFIVTNSEFNRAVIERIVPERRAAPIHVIYEGLDLAQFVAESRRIAPRDPIRILSVGRLVEPKGFEYLLQALALVRERGRRFRCVIVGGSGKERGNEYERRLTDLRRALQLDDAVRFAGALPFDQVLQEYAQADVFALPCVVARDGSRDVTPNALIEAMAMKLAAVSTNITAIPEIVTDRIHGLLVPPRNPPALAQALIALIEDPALRATLGENARRRVEERFDIRQNARCYVELFAGKS